MDSHSLDKDIGPDWGRADNRGMGSSRLGRSTAEHHPAVAARRRNQAPVFADIAIPPVSVLMSKSSPVLPSTRIVKSPVVAAIVNPPLEVIVLGNTSPSIVTDAAPICKSSLIITVS